MDTDLAQALAHDPQLTVFEQQASSTEIGANVAWFSGSRANNLVIYVNQLKGARPWDDPSNTGRIAYDENGYPTVVPERYVASDLLIRSRDVAGIAPHTGMFRLYGRGAGQFSIHSSTDGQLTGKLNAAFLPTENIQGTEYWFVDVNFDVNNEELARLRMQIHDVRPGTHIRSLALVHHTHLAAFRAGETFAPELLADLRGYGTLRFMDWMRANRIQEDGNGWGEEGSNWTSPTPEQRYVGPDYYTFNNHAGGAGNEGSFEVSAPISHIVELSNLTGADPWIALPVDITDTRAATLGRYVAENLDDGLVARWEYGNELFNSARGFEGYRYSLRMAQTTFEDFDEVGPWATVEWSAYRGPQLYKILGDVFDDAGREARFIAPGWAFSGSLRPGGSLSDGYLVRYFQAREAQEMNDGTPLPLEVVTDYSVAMYFGGTLADRRPDAVVAQHVLKTVDGAEAQAEALADWLIFGSNPEQLVTLTAENLRAPRRDVPWSDDLDIAVTRLIWADIEAGLDPLTDLPRVLRLNGRALQYRGEGAADWTDVLIFDRLPTRSLEQMIAHTQLVGYGGTLFGQIFTGLRSGLALSTSFRLDAHADYAQALGLNFVAYEGGSHVSYPVDGAFDMYEAFNTGPAGARVLGRWLEIMSEKGLNEYMHFMSHSRTSGNDWWGVKDYIGQDVTSSPEAVVLRQAIDAYDPSQKTGRTGPLSQAKSVDHTETGALLPDLPVVWRHSRSWKVLSDGAAVESGGSNNQLRLSRPLPVTGGATYGFSFEVGLDGTESTEIRLVARAKGEQVTELERWQGVVKNGSKVDFELGPLLDGHRLLSIAVQRVGRDRSGSLTVRNADLRLKDR